MLQCATVPVEFWGSPLTSEDIDESGTASSAILRKEIIPGDAISGFVSFSSESPNHLVAARNFVPGDVILSELAVSYARASDFEAISRNAAPRGPGATHVSSALSSASASASADIHAFSKNVYFLSSIAIDTTALSYFLRLVASSSTIGATSGTTPRTASQLLFETYCRLQLPGLIASRNAIEKSGAAGVSKDSSEGVTRTAPPAVVGRNADATAAAKPSPPRQLQQQQKQQQQQQRIVCLFLRGSMVLHSCLPNSLAIVKWDHDAGAPSLSLIAMQPIQKGEAVVVSKVDPLLPMHHRHVQLSHRGNFGRLAATSTKVGSSASFVSSSLVASSSFPSSPSSSSSSSLSSPSSSLSPPSCECVRCYNAASPREYFEDTVRIRCPACSKGALFLSSGLLKLPAHDDDDGGGGAGGHEAQGNVKGSVQVREKQDSSLLSASSSEASKDSPTLTPTSVSSPHSSSTASGISVLQPPPLPLTASKRCSNAACTGSPPPPAPDVLQAARSYAAAVLGTAVNDLRESLRELDVLSGGSKGEVGVDGGEEVGEVLLSSTNSSNSSSGSSSSSSDGVFVTERRMEQAAIVSSAAATASQDGEKATSSSSSSQVENDKLLTKKSAALQKAHSVMSEFQRMRSVFLDDDCAFLLLAIEALPLLMRCETSLDIYHPKKQPRSTGIGGEGGAAASTARANFSRGEEEEEEGGRGVGGGEGVERPQTVKEGEVGSHTASGVVEGVSSVAAKTHNVPSLSSKATITPSAPLPSSPSPSPFAKSIVALSRDVLQALQTLPFLSPLRLMEAAADHGILAGALLQEGESRQGWLVAASRAKVYAQALGGGEFAELFESFARKPPRNYAEAVAAERMRRITARA